MISLSFIATKFPCISREHLVYLDSTREQRDKFRNRSVELTKEPCIRMIEPKHGVVGLCNKDDVEKDAVHVPGR